jgi:hypothetical protein
MPIEAFGVKPLPVTETDWLCTRSVDGDTVIAGVAAASGGAAGGTTVIVVEGGTPVVEVVEVVELEVVDVVDVVEVAGSSTVDGVVVRSGGSTLSAPLGAAIVRTAAITTGIPTKPRSSFMCPPGQTAAFG